VDPEAIHELGLRGAGDENRTRTISLGSAVNAPGYGADLPTLVRRTIRGSPLITLVNGPLMAQGHAQEPVRSSRSPATGHLPGGQP
jgi:hypothetical protein